MHYKHTRTVITLFITCLSQLILAQQPSFKPIPLSEIEPDGWIKNQLVSDWSTGSFAMMVNNAFFPTTLGAIAVGRSPKFLDPENRWVYTWNFSEMEGNLADGVIRAAFLSDNSEVRDYARDIMNFMVEKVAATQYGDSVALAYYNGGELFNQTCMERAMLAYFEYTGDSKYLEAVVSLVDKTIIQWNKKFDDGQTYFGRTYEKKGAMFHSQAYGDILEYLYRTTGDIKYVNFAFRLYNDFSASASLMDSHGADAALDILSDPDRMFIGHGPHTAEHLRLPLWLSTFTEDSSQQVKEKYRQAAENIPVKLNKSLSPTKGLVTDPNKHESVNGKYSSGYLPYEYCSLTETFHTLTFMSRELGKSGFADDAEILFFNAAQAARFSNGEANAYLSSDNIAKATSERNWRDQYSALHGIRCCNLNAARIAPYYVAGMWMKSENGQDLVSLLHGPSQLNTTIGGVKVTIITDTNYPFENTVNYTIIPESPVEFTLKIRNPSWSGNTKVECEGAEITLADGFYKVEKTFTEFDKVSVIFEHAITLNKLDNPDSKDFYIQRGPLVYTYPYSNEKYPIQARDGFPGYYHWNIEIPASLGSDFVSMKMHSNSNAMFERDSSFLRFQVLDTFDPQEPYAFPRGKITGRFIANRIFTERDLIPIGCAITRRTTFSPSTLISDLSPATIELDGNNEIAIGSTVQFNATVRDQENTILTNPECVWSASAGSINQQGIYTAPDSITTAIITISCGNITSEFPVNINHKLSKADEKVSQDLLAYPTITSGMLHFSRPIENQIFVYNIYGKKLLDKHDHRTQQIDLSSFSSGFYIIQTGRHVFKIYKY